MKTYSGCFKPMSVRGHDDSCTIPLNLSFLKGCCSQTHLIIPHKISIWLEAECISTNGPNSCLFSMAASYLQSRCCLWARGHNLRCTQDPRQCSWGSYKQPTSILGWLGVTLNSLQASCGFQATIWLPLVSEIKIHAIKFSCFSAWKLMPALETEA